MPGTTEVALLVLVMARSTVCVIVLTSVSLLLAGVGSGTEAGAMTVAVLLKDPVAELTTVAFNLNVAVLPGRRSTVVLMLPLPLGAPQAPPVEAVQVQVTLVSLVGTMSLTVAPVTVLGPLLRTVIVYIVCVPATTVFVPSVLVIERSAIGVSVFVSLAVSLFGFGSTAPPGIPTVAVFVIVPVAEGLGVTVKLNVAVPPFNRLTLVLILPVPFASWHEEPVEATQVQEAARKTGGRVSTTGMPKTSFGPLFRTTIE